MMLTNPQKDTQRALAAARALFDGRDPVEEMSEVLVTLDNLVALVLLVTMQNDHRKAVGMLHEGLVPGVEGRIMLGASRERK